MTFNNQRIKEYLRPLDLKITSINKNNSIKETFKANTK